jgi:putative FmdB family regulatory protein
MPTYSYRCSNCGHEFDIEQKIKDEPLKTCPHCHFDYLNKIITSAPGISFKGHGFHCTDYKSKRG